ncbi:MAG: aminotransferase class V-fold PLP-dependent enzyme [Meiothermus sp.]|uniref:pyridoxal-phosphate-dependent aminotransferase family protein n=1 Tax=Meiothermus sp. TaxID=1955249 RepID=UPI0025E5BA40|nr:aminotransferase class V-fold PLP-dependent enzyme [Meiothermus sp.]MCS7058571.1 aminotransferase class V-fold PLP-dependent enzyme [Meiothermus sp.]MCS7193752.1 aminotransferase class V-fold PLP-dependent enzyme [Meiothermus sp.]MCX7740507.1 aminotransferase class V-fold PLP-dependent enzyme [Meiothermus sp.]MDW8091503.1 aminotransferase class V-fold PLP-dependent enzyme [Meiothermus sp.]MDW8481971.1 aminotransferase class V-fold PLP-dependent enzyme [Meiothermus sp.]
MVLLTPGPTPIHPRVQAALGKEMRGHLDPEVLAINRRIRNYLNHLFDPGEGALLAALPGSGSLGMEAGLTNLADEGDPVLLLVSGTFGERMVEIAHAYRLDYRVLRSEPGHPIDPQAVAQELKRRPYKLVALVHGETSTGVLNPVEAIAPLVQEHGALFMLDAVTTAGMMPLSMQQLGVDYAFTGSQKCLSAPPGLAPFALSERGRECLGQVRGWYSDLSRVAVYWEQEGYFCTSPVLLHYALEEALRLALEEGLGNRQKRAQQMYTAVLSLLEELGFSAYAAPEARLPTVLVVRPPKGLNEAEIRKGLYARGVSVAGGIGPTAGKVLRLGLMGESARPEHYRVFFRALGEVLGLSGLERAFEERLGLVMG